MALIKSSLLSDIRGSVGGTTYSRNRGGSYARNRTVPINPQSSSQTRARSDLAQYSVGWASLTNAQRLAWNQYAETVVALNVLGESITYTGQQMYIRSNTLLELASLAAVNSPPPSNVQLSIAFGDSPTVNYDVSDNEIVATLQQNFTGTVLVFTGPPQSVGSYSLKVPYRFFGTQVLANQTAINAPGGGDARVYIAGQHMAVRFVGIGATGLVSNEVYLRALAVA
jgi:hypothetical protein